jgi:hypothetical protein
MHISMATPSSDQCNNQNSNTMKTIRTAFFCLAAAATLIGAGESAAQESFVLSSTLPEMKFTGAQKAWDGRHYVRDVFCLLFPDPEKAESFTQSMYDDNTIYLSLAAYAGSTAMYVVTTAIEEGHTPGFEMANLTEIYRKQALAYPKQYAVMEADGSLGKSLAVTIRNPKETAKKQPFPLAFTIARRADAPLSSLSVHRLFVHDKYRIEVAGLQQFANSIGTEQGELVRNDLEVMVEKAAESLQSCTAKLHR